MRLQQDRRLIELRRREVALDDRALASQRLQLDLLVGDVVQLLLVHDVGDEFVRGERLVAIGFIARRLDARLLQLHLAIDLRELVIEILHAPAQLLDLLRPELAPALLFLLEIRAPPLHLRGNRRARGSARAGHAIERDFRHLIAGLHLVAFLHEEVGDASRVRDEHARGAGIECEVPLDALAPRVLAPQRDADQKGRGSSSEEREGPEGNGTSDGGFTEEFLSLGVDRLLSE